MPSGHVMISLAVLLCCCCYVGSSTGPEALSAFIVGEPQHRGSKNGPDWNGIGENLEFGTGT